MHNELLLSCKEKRHHSEARSHYVKQNKPDLQRQLSHVFPYVWNLGLSLCMCVYIHILYIYICIYKYNILYVYVCIYVGGS